MLNLLNESYEIQVQKSIAYMSAYEKRRLKYGLIEVRRKILVAFSGNRARVRAFMCNLLKKYGDCQIDAEELTLSDLATQAAKLYIDCPEIFGNITVKEDTVSSIKEKQAA